MVVGLALVDKCVIYSADWWSDTLAAFLPAVNTVICFVFPNHNHTPQDELMMDPQKSFIVHHCIPSCFQASLPRGVSIRPLGRSSGQFSASATLAAQQQRRQQRQQRPNFSQAVGASPIVPKVLSSGEV